MSNTLGLSLTRHYFGSVFFFKHYILVLYLQEVVMKLPKISTLDLRTEQKKQQQLEQQRQFLLPLEVRKKAVIPVPLKIPIAYEHIT